MGLIPNSEIAFVRGVGRVNYANPFLQERLDCERAALGDDYVPELQPYWSFRPQPHVERRGNLVRLTERANTVAEGLRAKLLAGVSASDEQIQMYDDLVNYIVFYELFGDWDNRNPRMAGDDSQDRKDWQKFSSRFDYWLKLPGRRFSSANEKVHLFALFRQIYRAFFHIFECVIGHSLPAARLRANIWQSIFTHDLRRYRRSLHRTLHEVTTLVTGPSGSGKELVARAIGMSRYIPFDPRQGCFAAHPDQVYFAINISAFSKNLVEGELFGHAKGAYTDAGAARAGWLEACGEHGAVLLDEIGELDPTTQTKLLRVLQNRQYQRLGETRMRRFEGKIIAATNRDLRHEIDSGTFREDLYYRLCSDVIETPSLSDQLRDNPDVLYDLVTHLAQRIAPDEHESLAGDVMDWLQTNLSVDYAWPGNIRELEQCVRNIMIRGQYVPRTRAITSPDPASANLVQQMQSLSLTAEELVQIYCRMAYEKTRSFEKSAKLLQLDRRTIRAKVDRLQQDGQSNVTRVIVDKSKEIEHG